jgi:lipopolysaccharide transport system ATP-binding protein
MGSDVVIKVENVSKLYRLGTIGMTSMVEDIHRTWAKWTGKEDPYQKVATENIRYQKQISDYVWSLQNINFEINRGDAVGIIGKNGAGKSTLLKLLSRVTTPTTGNIKMKGRISSLLEVGTGFHPELTGRENVFMNGTIMGLSRKDISKQLDAIVDFSGVEQYLDTPVKRYSSGMYVRLAFAVAAHLEPDILIVDEVLAVGDAEFQKKCIAKMREINKVNGRTLLFVSHNLSLINNFCSKGLLLQNGSLLTIGNISNVIDEYNNRNQVQGLYNESLSFDKLIHDKISLDYFNLFNTNLKSVNTFNSTERILIEFGLTIFIPSDILRVVFYLYNSSGVLVFMTSTFDNQVLFNTIGKKNLKMEIPDGLLNEGEYDIFIQVGEPGVGVIFEKMFLTKLEVIYNASNDITLLEKFDGIIRPDVKWKLN